MGERQEDQTRSVVVTFCPIPLPPLPSHKKVRRALPVRGDRRKAAAERPRQNKLVVTCEEKHGAAVSNVNGRSSYYRARGSSAPGQEQAEPNFVVLTRKQIWTEWKKAARQPQGTGSPVSSWVTQVHTVWRRGLPSDHSCFVRTGSQPNFFWQTDRQTDRQTPTCRCSSQARATQGTRQDWAVCLTARTPSDTAAVAKRPPARSAAFIHRLLGLLGHACHCMCALRQRTGGRSGLQRERPTNQLRERERTRSDASHPVYKMTASNLCSGHRVLNWRKAQLPAKDSPQPIRGGGRGVHREK